jgi:hypothetical protein
MLGDEDIAARIAAAGATWKVDRRSDEAIPVLVQVLEKSNTDAHHLWVAYEIAAIGPDAKAAVPALRNSLARKTPWPDEFAHALGNIGPDAADAAPDIAALLNTTTARFEPRPPPLFGRSIRIRSRFQR